MLSSVFMIIVLDYMIHRSYAAGTLFSTTPQSRNVSIGTMVNFTCAAPASELTSFGITIVTTPPPAGGTDIDDNTLPNGANGVRQVTLSFIAPSDQTSIIITCAAISSTTGLNEHIAVLMIQGLLPPVGNLTSTEVDNCTLRFTWTAPYTLQGVPINYYTINITRHSDGAVLRSDTINTTEYLYSVSSLGETLEVVVAAVNGAGTGNATSIMIQSPSSINLIRVPSVFKGATRNGKTNWTYTIDFKEEFICGGAISGVTVEACLNSSCNSTNGIVSMLSDGMRRVMAKFTDLMENRKYTATLNINYNGGVVQQSQPVEISTFDVRNATLNSPVVGGRVCLDVTYVEGQPVKASFILFKCSTTGRSMYNATINQSRNCTTVPAHPAYNIMATDDDNDAVNMINTTAAVTITNVFVSSYITVTQATVSLSNMATTTPSHSSSGTTIGIVVGSIIGGLVVVTTTISLVALVIYRIKRRKTDNKVKQTDIVEMNPSGHQSKYEHKQRAEVVYADVGVRSHVAPLAPPSIDSVEYGKVLMSEGQRQCLKRLVRMESLLLNYTTLYELLQPLALQWRQFGDILYLAPYLDNIQTNNSSDEERLQAVLKCWQENQVRPYTWETLVTVLGSSEVGATYLAIELKKKSNKFATVL